jgi:23S rRNA (guanosine2251-2'-O)-methyltransferase
MYKMKKFWIYGKHPVLAALNNPNRYCSQLLVTEQVRKELKLPSVKGLEVKIVSQEIISRTVGAGIPHQNIALETMPLETPSIEEVLRDNSSNTQSCFLILDQITDPQNVGSIIRSAAAFNIDGIILTTDNSPNETGALARAASGTLELIPLIRVTNLASTMKILQQHGYWIIGFDIEGKPLNSSMLNGKIAIVLGAEGKGMRRLTKENCDIIARIPMQPNVESLNVANAAAIACYEWFKPRV